MVLCDQWGAPAASGGVGLRGRLSGGWCQGYYAEYLVVVRADERREEAEAGHADIPVCPHWPRSSSGSSWRLEVAVQVACVCVGGEGDAGRRSGAYSQGFGAPSGAALLSSARSEPAPTPCSAVAAEAERSIAPARLTDHDGAAVLGCNRRQRAAPRRLQRAVRACCRCNEQRVLRLLFGLLGVRSRREGTLIRVGVVRVRVAAVEPAPKAACNINVQPAPCNVIHAYQPQHAAYDLRHAT